MCEPAYDPFPVTLDEAYRESLVQEERWQREDAAAFRREAAPLTDEEWRLVALIRGIGGAL